VLGWFKIPKWAVVILSLLKEIGRVLMLGVEMSILPGDPIAIDVVLKEEKRKLKNRELK